MFNWLLASSQVTVPWFPASRALVLVEVDAVSHAVRVPCQKFVVPHFNSRWKLLEPPGIAKSADHVVLRNLSDTRLEFFYSRMAA